MHDGMVWYVMVWYGRGQLTLTAHGTTDRAYASELRVIKER